MTDLTHTTIRWPDDLLARVDVVAEQMSMSRSRVVNIIVRQHFDILDTAEVTRLAGPQKIASR